MAAQPLARMPLSLGDLRLGHLASDFHAIAFGFRVPAQSGKIEPLVGHDQVERNIAPHAVHQAQLKQSVGRAATWCELDGLYHSRVKSCHDTGLCLPGLSVHSEETL
jgi:hypothetical protein